MSHLSRRGQLPPDAISLLEVKEVCLPPARWPWLPQLSLGSWLSKSPAEGPAHSTWRYTQTWFPADTYCGDSFSYHHLPSPPPPYLLPIGNAGTIQLCSLWEHIYIPAGKRKQLQTSSGSMKRCLQMPSLSSWPHLGDL